MSDLAAKRCHVHLDREAAARCPECRQFYCRECITEHDEIVICTGCLKQQTTKSEPQGKRTGVLLRGLAGMAGTLLCWICFIWVSKILLAIPSAFHEGSLWKVGFWER